MNTNLTQEQLNKISPSEKKWYRQELAKIGIVKHPQNKDNLKKYKTSELATILFQAKENLA